VRKVGSGTAPQEGLTENIAPFDAFLGCFLHKNAVGFLARRGKSPHTVLRIDNFDHLQAAVLMADSRGIADFGVLLKQGLLVLLGHLDVKMLKALQNGGKAWSAMNMVQCVFTG
jgi:hypothetical protein